MNKKLNRYVTIVIPSYNEENYIYNTLWLLSKQDLNLRVIIADGGSDDKTLEMISKASEKFNNLQIEVTQGGPVGFARNNGAKLVDTPYILFIDADAILVEDDIIKKTLELSEKYDVITCKQKSMSTTDKKSVWVFKIFNLIRRIMPETFCTGVYFFISKEKFEKLGGFDEKVLNSEDFWLSRQIPKSKFKILDRYVGQDNRRFKKMGYFGFIKMVILNYLNKNNYKYFTKDIGYWK